MAAGIAVLAAPAVVLGGIGVGVASAIKNKKLADEKHALYTKALEKQNAIIELLKNKYQMSKDRIDYLTSLNITLQAAIRDLQHDIAA